MKTKSFHRSFIALSFCMLPGAIHAAPLAAYDGVHLDSGGNTILDTFDAALGSKSINLYSKTGGLFLYSDVEESAPGIGDGGVYLWGNSVNVILSHQDGYAVPYSKAGVFTVCDTDDFGVDPVLTIDGVSRATAFSGSDITVDDGSLKVDGNDVLTASSAATAGFVQTSTLTSALNGLSTVPYSSAWTTAYLARGSVSSGGLFAAGSSATASNSNAVAISSGTASGQSSFAGGSGTASGNYSFAFGIDPTAAGSSSIAWGTNSSSKTYQEVVFGRNNVESPTPTNSITWNDLHGLFRVGNGSTSSTRSDALTVLKNGRTTLTNRFWKTDFTSDPDTALDDPSSSDDSGGEALVVDGHTILNGKVIISVPQGDISLGIYE